MEEVGGCELVGGEVWVGEGLCVGVVVVVDVGGDEDVVVECGECLEERLE